MKKSVRIILWLSVFLALAGMAWAVSVNYSPYGIATPRIYQSTYGYTRNASSYYLAPPTLSANDTICGLTSTQTLTNKTLTAPTLTAVTITGTSTIGSGMTITSPSLVSPAITGTSTIASGCTITSASIVSPAITGTSTIGAGMTITSPAITSPTITGTTSISGTTTISAATLVTPTVSAATITGSTYAGTAALTTGTVSSSLTGGGTAVQSGFLKTVASKAAGYSMTAADSGKVIYVSASAEMDLPDAVVGTIISVAVADSVTAVVNPLGSDTIVGLTNAGGDSITNTGNGSITLICPVADKWYPFGTAYGTWSDSD